VGGCDSPGHMFDKTSVVGGGIDRDGRARENTGSPATGGGAARSRMLKRGCVIRPGRTPIRGAKSSRGVTGGRCFGDCEGGSTCSG